MREWICARTIKPVVFLACLRPIALLVWNAAAGKLGANPLEEIRDTTGIWTLRFLVFTLAISPLRHLAGWQSAMRFRRMLGLFAFFYGVLHFISYVWFDQFFALDAMLEDLTKRSFIIAGYISFVPMLPLAITSTRKWIARVGGRRWQILHRLIYLSAAAGVVHYFWRVKLDVQRPVLYGLALALLLVFRLATHITSTRSGSPSQYAQRKYR